MTFVKLTSFKRKVCVLPTRERGSSDLLKCQGDERIFAVRNGKFVLTTNRSKHHVRSPKRSSYYLASAGSWQFSEIKHPGTSGIVSVLFFFYWTIVRENKAPKRPKDFIENESRGSSRTLLSRKHAITATSSVGAVSWFSQQANWFTFFFWSHSRVCSQIPFSGWYLFPNELTHSRSMQGEAVKTGLVQLSCLPLRRDQVFLRSIYALFISINDRVQSYR